MFRKYYKTNSDNIECYYVELNKEISREEENTILSIIDPNLYHINVLDYIEYGPNINMVTPWCSNALAIFSKCGVNCINRIERSFLVEKQNFDSSLVDPMVQTIYKFPLESFSTNSKKHNDFYYVKNIEKENSDKKLGFDETDIDYYKKLYKKLKRKPTNIELYDLAQSNSEHSRHWFFKGKIVKDGKLLTNSLFKMIKNTQNGSNKNSIIAFKDNASAIKGFNIKKMYTDINSYEIRKVHKIYHTTFTAETHNFPTGIAPFPGAATGVGGRIRDTHAIGRGGLVVAGTAGYCVGNLDNSKYTDKNIRTLIKASDGASDYGNKFGEPIILGFCRSFGQTINKQRVEWTKPIMFSGGIGLLENEYINKYTPDESMLVVKLGGPAFRIGVGGGSASSRDQNTKNSRDDHNAVQRGDPEMENKLNRVIRACIELEHNNPILSIHDQGAGGTANVTKEIVYPKGAKINLDKIVCGDETMNALELWVSEFQEQDTILTDSSKLNILKKICKRENVPIAVIGHVNSSGKIKVYENSGHFNKHKVVDLPLEPVLGDNIPQKVYNVEEVKQELQEFDVSELQEDLITIITKVFRKPSVGSKRFLTNKVDRSVTGLIAQQQCIGPLHTPLSNFGIIAQSYYGSTGSVTSIGERPLIGLIDSAAMARMAVGEMLTNMMFAKITSIKDIKCSGNWMWPMKLNGEQYEIYKACKAMCDTVEQFGIALDGGKDSLSMVYKDGKTGEIVKCPRELVISGYALMEDISCKVTPDFKQHLNEIIYIDLAHGKQRLGGSVLAQCYNKIGKDCPDMVNTDSIIDIFNKIQKFIQENKIVSGHDRSDGGLITTLCEMAFSGNFGLNVNIGRINPEKSIKCLFNEELGVVIEVEPQHTEEILNVLNEHINCAHFLGKVIDNNKITVADNSKILMNENMAHLRDIWEERSFELEMLQCNKECVKEEKDSMKSRKNFKFSINKKLDSIHTTIPHKWNVAIIREEGSNSDREMMAAFDMAGFNVYDICMNDLINDKTLTLDKFRGVVFVGGFSFSDVLGSGKGWYEVIRNNKRIKRIFDKFYKRKDTFSLGVCNGCQLMARLGWIPKCELKKNKSKRFESRFSHIKVKSSKSIMLKGFDDSYLGIWVAHGEGRFELKEEVHSSSIPVQYVDDSREITEKYPFNPNGSEDGIAALCSDNGRHLAIMPHPERSFLEWQWPYNNDAIMSNRYTPWFKMFVNAYLWCDSKN